jgi:DNA-directed RNA polymerase subunit RPC12/RpoP
MAMLQFACPHCGRAFQVDEDMAGRQAACPSCGGTLLVPATAPPAETSTPAAPEQFPPLREPAGASAADSAAVRVETRPAERKLRRLSREEKQRLRFRRNLAMLALGLTTLIVVLLLLVRQG